MRALDLETSQSKAALEAKFAATPQPRYDPRTRALIEGPIVATLIRLAAPNVLVMLAQTSVGLRLLTTTVAILFVAEPTRCWK